MLRQMRESMLCQTVHVSVAGDTLNDSVFQLAQMMLCVMTIHNFLIFVGQVVWHTVHQLHNASRLLSKSYIFQWDKLHFLCFPLGGC